MLAIVAALIGVASSPIALLLQLRGASLSTALLAFAVPMIVLSIVALILGIVARLRPGSSIASPSAAIGIAGFLIIEQFVQIVAALVVSAL